MKNEKKGAGSDAKNFTFPIFFIRNNRAAINCYDNGVIAFFRLDSAYRWLWFFHLPSL